MKKILLNALVLVCLTATSSFGQSWTWNKVVDPTNTNSDFKRFGFYASGSGFTFQEYSNFQVFNITKDGGKTWEQKSLPPAPTIYASLQDLWAADENNIYAIFGDFYKKNYHISVYSIAEDKWEEVGVIDMDGYTLSLQGSVAIQLGSVDRDWIYGKLYAQKDGEDLVHIPYALSDNGATYTDFTPNIPVDFTKVNFIEFYDNKLGLIIVQKTSTHTLLKTTDGGATWTDLGAIDATEFSNIQFIDDKNVVIGLESEIYLSSDAGDNWTKKKIGDEYTIIPEVLFTNPSCGIAISRTGNSSHYIMRTNDGGDTWTEDAVSEDVPDYSVSKHIYELGTLGCDSWYAITSRHIISNTDFPFTTSTGLDEQAAANPTNIFPNPSTGKINLTSDVRSFAIYNTNGQQIRKGLGQQTIDLQDLTDGLYLVQMEMSNGETTMEKLILAQ